MTTWEEVKRGSLFIRTTIFRLCILHGILCARQELGTRAMVKEYPFGVHDLEYAINLCIQLCVDQEINDSKTITKLCFSIIDVSILQLYIRSRCEMLIKRMGDQLISNVKILNFCMHEMRCILDVEMF